MHTANVTALTRQEEVIDWHSIEWQKVNRRVNNLRRRIYRASALGDKKKVRNLQKLMLKSFSNKLSAIRKVTQVNQGRRTPGIDKVVVRTAKEKSWLISQLGNTQIETNPIKRVYIPKKNGKKRPLGLTTILDRCRQAMVKSALEPYWEAKFEGCSYGFRPGRSAQDAIQKIFGIVCPGRSRLWVLDADIEGAFDNIDHDFLMKSIGHFPGRHWIRAWLKSGVMAGGEMHPTLAGTPQGGVISPLLANIALHGMEAMLNITFDSLGRVHKTSEYAYVRYADDFVVFAKSKVACEQAKQRVATWLKTRGLKLSESKTQISPMDDGFDFLGFTIRHYKTRCKRKGKVLLTQPSKASIKSFKKAMTLEWKQCLSWETERVIANLNPKIKGWSHYFRHGTSKKTFNTLQAWMWQRQRRFVLRRHPNKHWWWLKKRYFGKIKGRNDNWVFMDKRRKDELFLWKLHWTPIKRHCLVKGKASPDNPALREYWQKRQARHSKYTFKLRNILWRKQQGHCLVCKDNIDNGEPIHIHHRRPKKLGGSDRLDNLVMLHAECHRQVHSKSGSRIAEVSKLLEPCAG